AYWIPDAKHFVPQNDTTEQQIADTHIAAIPSVVDDFRNPILAWVADDTAVGSITTSNLTDARDQFAKIVVVPNKPPAKFYWASNACFLQATALGRGGANQSSSSALGLWGAANRADSLCGMLGSPNYPNKKSGQPGSAPQYPSTARAPVVLHSAGADGVFV